MIIYILKNESPKINWFKDKICAPLFPPLYLPEHWFL